VVFGEIGVKDGFSFFCFFLLPFGEIKSSAKIIIPSVENNITKKIFNPELSGVVVGVSSSSFNVVVLVVGVVVSTGEDGSIIGFFDMFVIIVRSLYTYPVCTVVAPDK